MKIRDLLKEDRVTVSCELFPPKRGGELEKAKAVVRDMARLNPAFMSVTYGAGGTHSRNTVEIANEIENVNGVTALAHMTCVSSEREQVRSMLEELRAFNHIARDLRSIIDRVGDESFAISFGDTCDRVNEKIESIFDEN